MNMDRQLKFPFIFVNILGTVGLLSESKFGNLESIGNEDIQKQLRVLTYTKRGFCLTKMDKFEIGENMKRVLHVPTTKFNPNILNFIKNRRQRRLPNNLLTTGILYK